MSDIEDHEAEHTGAGNTPAKIGDLQGIQASYRLNGRNYLKWSQVVRTFLKGKGKLKHLTGDGPAEDDPGFEAWDEEDSLIVSWLWNSMSPEISDTCLFLNTAREIWETVRQTYSKVKDAAQIYELKTKINSAKQGNKSITEYSTYLQRLWQELDHYQCIQMINTDDAITLKRVIEKDRIFAFLAGLNPELDAVRVQILGKEELPSLNEVISIVRAEEGRRGVMLNDTGEENSAHFVKNSKNWESKEKYDRKSNDNKAGNQNGGMTQKGYSKNPEKDSLFCTYCKKNRHTGENCWKLHGRNKDKELAHAANAKHEDEQNPMSLHGLDKVEVGRLKKLLETLEEPPKCSLTLSVCVIPGTNKEYDEKTAIEFLQKAVKSDKDFSINIAIRTAISGLQHLFQKKFKANEIEVSVMDPNYLVPISEKKDLTIQDLPIRRIKDHLVVINDPYFEGKEPDAEDLELYWILKDMADRGVQKKNKASP